MANVLGLVVFLDHPDTVQESLNLFRPEFTIVIFIHHNPRIAVAILDLYRVVDEDDSKWVEK